MATEPSDFVQIGEIIGGYRLERLLGAGSTSQVFLGNHVVLGRKAAIKVLVDKLIGNEDVINRLLTEAKVANDIRHPNIIDISDFINTTSPRRVALVMEYVEGPSLSTCREHPLSFEHAIGLMLQLVAAVRAAHSAGIIHRDIKPDNLLLTTDPRTNTKEVPTLKIVDFGIAKMAHSNLAQTAVGTMLGTPAYMAPEQIAGRPRPSAATDVFAIGEVLYEVLTSKRAYPAGTISETVRAKLRGELPRLELPPIPGDKRLLEIIRRCLARRPEDRPGLQEIQNVLEELRPSSKPIETMSDFDDASESATRLVGTKPPPPAATILDLARTEPTSIPNMRRIPKDVMTSPTNRVLDALTELNRRDLQASAERVRDEPSLSIGELRIAGGGRSDDEASVEFSDSDISRIAQPVVFDDEDPLRITPPSKRPSNPAPLAPLEYESGELPSLGLDRPVGLASLDQDPHFSGLDADDLHEETEPPLHPRPRGDSTTMPPMLKPSPLLQPMHADSGPDVPDTRITAVRRAPPPGGSNHFFYLLIFIITIGTALAFLIATDRIDLASDAPVVTPPIDESSPSQARTNDTPQARPVLDRE